MAERWEYTTKPLPFVGDAGKKLTEWAGYGWELVAVTRWDRDVTAYLKRRIR